MIQPRRYYGDDEKPKIADVLTAAAPAVSSLISQFSDPRRQVGVLTAKLQAQIARGASPQTIAITRAKLDAARHQLALASEGEGATREWRGLGQTAIATGIGVGFALIVLLAMLAKKASRST